MKNGFVKMGRVNQTLLTEHPKAFLLLAYIALHAQRNPRPSSGLKPGQCKISRRKICEELDITEREFRTAFSVLVNDLIIDPVTTRQGSRRNVVVSIRDTEYYDLNILEGVPVSDPVTTRQTTPQTTLLTRIKNKDKKEGDFFSKNEKKEEAKGTQIPRPANPNHPSMRWFN